MGTSATSPNPAEMLSLLAARFAQHPARHPGIPWADVEARLKRQTNHLHVLGELERTGGEPDVVVLPGQPAELIFVDCSGESPVGRRSLCFDEPARLSRKDAPPAGSALGWAAQWGVDLLDEAQYRALQTLGAFDQKTSSWLQTPAAIRDRGGALFGDRRYDHVFVYHNGAQSYYAARGFRAVLRVG